MVVDVYWWCLRFCLGQCAAVDWKFSFISSSSGRWVCCMLNDWFSSNDDICPDNFYFSRFKLKDKCRSEKWEVYLGRAHDQYHEDFGCVCLLFFFGSAATTGLHRQPQLLPVQVEGHGVAVLVVDAHVVQLRWGCSWRDGMSFRVVYTGTRPGVSPAIRAGKGWRGRRELAPRCSATRISCIARTCQDRLAVSLII